ncbi:MAG: aminotransferase class III-fold pyridoxal phosphate-dependent enzyme [Acidimicrobiales bacterium]|nr:aminotransferase class III-fold pyridoxal phosphate-dependent enzyme [Acidimicrobiales bacterium]
MTSGSAPVDRNRLDVLMAAERQRFRDEHPRSAELAAAARDHLLGGVPMAWMTRWPGAFPVFAAAASGARVTDVDGHVYVDLALGDTGSMCGHALPFVAEAVAAQATKGLATMLPHPDAVWVGGELSRRFGLPTWQLAMTATDANRFALRLARHLTGRPKVLVFDWCYHGTVDETLVTMGPGGRTLSRPASAGPPCDPALTTRVVQFNDLAAVEAALAEGDVACVLTEPALTNIGIVLPDAGFHDGLRACCSATGTLLVIDETHTICAGPGGATAAWGLHPDLLTIGKPIGGGVPAAAYGMTGTVAEGLRALVHDEGIDVSGIGGTLTAGALALAAMRATLSGALRDDDFAVAIPLAERWAAGVRGVIDDLGLPWSVQRLGCRAEYWFCPPPRNGAEAAAAVDHELDALLHLWCLNRGILLTPFHNMALFSSSHTTADVDLHTAVFRSAALALVA